MSEMQISMDPKEANSEGMPTMQEETRLTDSRKIRKARGKHGRLIISVTQEDIDKGVPTDSRKCMVAEAVKRSVPEAKNVSVDFATIRYTSRDTGDRYIYATPQATAGYLMAFEHGIKPPPFAFRLSTLYQIRPKSAIPHKTPHARIATEDITETIQHRPTAPVKIGGQLLPRTPRIPGTGYIRRFGIRTPNLGTVEGD